MCPGRETNLALESVKNFFEVMKKFLASTWGRRLRSRCAIDPASEDEGCGRGRLSSTTAGQRDAPRPLQPDRHRHPVPRRVDAGEESAVREEPRRELLHPRRGRLAVVFAVEHAAGPE